MNEAVRECARTIWDYHHLGHCLEPADVIFVLGSHDLIVAEWGARLFLDKYAPLMVISGGYGVITKNLWRETEAKKFAAIAQRCGVPADKILLEERASNTGENVLFTKTLLQELGLDPQKLILVQKPYMERRTFATFKKIWPEKEVIVSTPDYSFEEYLERYSNHALGADAMVGIMVGDLQRIKEYPAMGFQIPQEIPEDVWAAYEELVRRGYTKYLIKK